MQMRQRCFLGPWICTLSALAACNAGQISPSMSQNASPAQQQQVGQQANNAGAADTRCKRGVAYNAMSPNDWRAASPNTVWFYSWSGQAQPQAIAADTNAMLHYVPMVWGQSQLAAMSPGNLPASGYLLGFNEPNFNSQANLTPTAAAGLWPKIETLAKAQNMNIVAPAVNYCGGGCTNTSPFDWLDQFFASCTDCRVDAVAIHVYMCDPNDVRAYVKQFETRYNKPLWVTEFACLDTASPTAAQQLSYMKAVVPIFEADPLIQRYAWFTGRDPSQPAVDLLRADGVLTPLGQAYVDLPQACTTP